MRSALVYAVVLLVPLGVLSVLWHVVESRRRAKRRAAEAGAGVADTAARSATRTGAPAPGLNGARPIERLRDDLHRLVAEIERIESTNPPAKAARLRAATLAYDDVLIAACRAMRLPTAERSPLDPLSRLEAEAELSLAGLSW